MNTVIKIIPFVLASLGSMDTATAGPRSTLLATGPSTNAADIPPLAKLLDEAGWKPTPELSGVYKTGSIFQMTDSDHPGHKIIRTLCNQADTSYTPACRAYRW